MPDYLSIRLQLHVLMLNLLHALLLTIDPADLNNVLVLVRHIECDKPEMAVAVASMARIRIFIHTCMLFRILRTSHS
jgi:hypothetical protein